MSAVTAYRIIEIARAQVAAVDLSDQVCAAAPGAQRLINEIQVLLDEAAQTTLNIVGAMR